MRIKRLVPMVFLVCPLILSSCGDKDMPGNGDNGHTEKEKMLWFDAEANFRRFADKEQIRYFIAKARETGFNKIVVDVKGVQADALYESSILAPMLTSDGASVNRDWDYLGYFLKTAREYGMKVTVSTTIFAGGKPGDRTGLVYNDSRWDGKTCMQYNADGTITDIRDDASKVTAFLNPVDKDVQDFALSFIAEIVSKYEIDAFALDYCRYPDEWSDFSETSRKAFEKYTGEKVENFPADIFTFDADGERVPGKYYKKWWEFRSMVISDFIGLAGSRIKAVRPNVELEYWAASWWQALYSNGQNWASQSYDPSSEYGWWATGGYRLTGFAEKLDTFLLGAYLTEIYEAGNMESIEFAIARADKIIGNACRIYGTLFSPNLRTNIDEAVYMCLTRTEGLMVFDISQVIEFDQWDLIKKGIDRAEAEQENKGKK